MRRKRKTSYSYYSPYSKKKRLRVDRLLMAVVAVVLVVGVIVGLNFNRIKLLAKGYSFKESSIVLKQSKVNRNELLSKAKVEHLTDWIALNLDASMYDEYDRYYALKPEMKVEDVVSTMDKFYSQSYDKLIALNYNDDQIWKMLENASLEDMEYLIDKGYTADVVSKYSDKKYFKYTSLEKYIEAYNQYQDYDYAVNIVNFPFIISTNQTSEKYLIKDPENILTLVKKGFYFASDYVPSDLVETSQMPIAEDCQNRTIRKEVADALDLMYQDAKKEGLELVFNSGYRSYETQTKTYKENESKYGGQYAAEYVALPGASEHQSGLGVDLTSQSVIDKTRITFGDTQEYQWVIANCAKYGFIVRFETGTADITGIAHEPWHLRYVGVDTAKAITDMGVTFEEYCLKTSTLPELEKQ